MAKNDTVLLDGIIDDRLEGDGPPTRRDEVFELFVFEQIFRDYDLSEEELDAGWVDGTDDGGIDGFFVLVNGHMLVDAETFVWPKAGAEIEVWIITCKHHETFRQAPLDTLTATLTEALDLSLTAEHFRSKYSYEVSGCRENLRFAYRKLSPRLQKFSVHFVYASRGDATKVGESVTARAEQIVNLAHEHFSGCVADFRFWGSSELVGRYRKLPSFSLELPFIEVLSKGETYLLLASLRDYFKFISDNGSLRRYLFDSNVRDFMGLNRVNEDIRETLLSREETDFWWLNNGVTMLASGASVVGKSIKLEDIQIVNGLQTTESIFRYLSEGNVDTGNRSVLVKVIVSNDDEARDAIIRSTNNQTSVELASLHATDKVQRDIEDVLKRSGFFYERRKNHYANLGHTSNEIVTPLFIASGYVALVLKNPWRAASLRSRFMRSSDSYKRVFNESTPLSIWPRIAAILKAAEEVIEQERPPAGRVGERFMKGWRAVISFIAVARFHGTFLFTFDQLLTMDIEEVTEVKFLRQIVTTVWNGQVPGQRSKMWSSRRSVVDVCKGAATSFGIKGFDEWAERGRQELPRSGIDSGSAKVDVSMEFACRVDRCLPEQPWKPGIEKAVISELGCTREEYFAATRMLIREGIRNNQKDGVVYDQNGNVVCFDVDRVDPETMQLIDQRGS